MLPPSQAFEILQSFFFCGIQCKRTKQKGYDPCFSKHDGGHDGGSDRSGVGLGVGHPLAQNPELF